MAKEIKQKTFVLRIDSRRMEAIEKWAADEFRSVNGQLLYIIDQALKKAAGCRTRAGPFRRRTKEEINGSDIRAPGIRSADYRLKDTLYVGG